MKKIWALKINEINVYVATLALDLQPRQGIARLQAKRETWESHHMLPRMQRM